MVPGLFSVASSMHVDERNHELIASNLANATLPGYRRQVSTVETFGQLMEQVSPIPVRARGATQGILTQTDFTQGELQHTGRSLDLALRGTGFFVLDGPNGPVYTRNGVFQISGSGELQTLAGLPVRGTSGHISVPPDATDIVVHADGTVTAGAGEVGRIELAHFRSPQQLRRIGAGLFQAPPGMASESGDTTVHQGYREMSNVRVVDEMVQMIVGMRHYEASQRALRTIAESIQLNTRPQSG